MEMFLKKHKRLLCVIAGVLLFGFASHLYRCFNLLANHDSMEIIMGAKDNNWQISLGRFLQPIYKFFRGNVSSPFLINIIAFIFVIASSYLIVKLIDLKSKGLIFILSGILISNAVFTCENATYVNWFDICAVCLFLSVLAVWIFRKYKFGFLYGIIPLFISLGLYQSYFQVAVALVLILFIFDVIKGKDYKAVFRKSVSALIMLLAALILYWIVSKLVCVALGVEYDNGYNSVSGVMSFSNSNPFLMFLLSYGQLFAFFFFPYSEHFFLCLVCGGAVLFYTIYTGIKLVIKSNQSKKGKRLAFALFGLMPFGMNFVCFLSEGKNHLLTWYPFMMMYVFAFALLEYRYSKNNCENYSLCKNLKKSTLKNVLVPAFVLVLAVDNIFFANNLYQKKHLEFTATESMLNKISYRLEQTNGYEPGETPVIFVGCLDDSPLVERRDGFSDIYHYAIGSKYKTSTPTQGSLKNYFEKVLAYPINIVSPTDEMLNSDEIKAMPAYPSKESVKFVDGVLVVKLSDEESGK